MVGSTTRGSTTGTVLICLVGGMGAARIIFFFVIFFVSVLVNCIASVKVSKH
jgi:hypothetical protein